MTTDAGSILDNDLEAIESQGWSLLEDERYSEAIEIFQDAFQRDRKNVAAFQGMIAAYRKQRSYAKAQSLLDDALSAHPGHPGIMSEQAWLCLALGNIDQAILAFDRLLQIYKSDEGLFLWKASLLREQQHFENAHDTLLEAVSLFPDSLRVRNEQGWLLYYQTRYDDALQMFESVLKSCDYNESAIQGRIACLRMKGCFAEATAIAEAALKLVDKSPGIRSESAWLHLDQGDLERAIEDLTKAVALVPKDPHSFINLAWVLVRRAEDNDLVIATERCREARRLDPDLPEAYGLLGVIASKMGSLREAEVNLLRSIKLDSVRGFYADLAALYLQMGRYDEARKKIEESLTNNPRNVFARIQMGNLYLLTDRPNDALREFRSAVAIEPLNQDACKALAVTLMENDKLNEAEIVLRDAIRRINKFGRWELHLTLCQVLARLGEAAGETRYYEEALEETGKAKLIYPGQSTSYFYSGVVRFKLDDFAGALKDFRRCREKDEHHLEADMNAKRIESRIRHERARSRASLFISSLLAAVVLGQLIALWLFRLLTEKVSEINITVLVPILLGLLVVAILLPWLTRLKITGIEAELTEPKPRESLVGGPKGDIGFRTLSPR